MNVGAAKRVSQFMTGFDLVLGSAALLAPDRTLRALGHTRPSADARHLFRRCGPTWLTFAAAHAVAAARGRPEDWWALAWLRATELLTDAVWSHSPGFRRPAARLALRLAGAANLSMALGFGAMAKTTAAERRSTERAPTRSTGSHGTLGAH
jgi:hypothetical protein